MSSRRKCRLDIKDANEETLKQAVAILAKELNARVVKDVGIYGGNSVLVPCGIQMEDGLQKGIGFRIEDGNLVSDGDSWGQEEQYHRVETLLKQTYAFVDSQNKLRSKGFSISSTIKVFGNKIVANIVGMKTTNA